MRRLLVVDDNPDAAHSLAHLLRLVEQWQIEIALSGHEALAKAEEFKPDLVLLDLVMPEMNGHLAAQHLRKKVPEAKIVILSGRQDEAMIEKSKAHGLEHIIKPADISTIIRLLEGKDGDGDGSI